MAKRGKDKESRFPGIYYGYEQGAKSPYRAWYYTRKPEKDGTEKSRPVPRRFKTERQRDVWAKEIDSERRDAGLASRALDPARRKQWEHADSMLETWEDPVDVVRQWRETHPRIGARPKKKISSPTANAVVDHFYATHEPDPTFVSNIYDSHMNRFRRQFGEKDVEWLCENKREIAKWIEGLDFASYTKRNQKSRVAVAFAEAVRDGLISESPFHRLAVKNGKKPTKIEYLSVDDCITLFAANYDRPGTCARLALGLLGGLRSSAVSRVQHCDFRLSIPALSIPDWKTKTGAADLIEAWPDVVWEWVRFADAEKFAPPCEDIETPEIAHRWKSRQESRWMHEKSNALKRAGLLITKQDKAFESGIPLRSPPKNWARHSFGTYHSAMYNNLELTSTLMSHAVSVNVLKQHYKGVAPKSEAERFFAITPEFIRSQLGK